MNGSEIELQSLCLLVVVVTCSYGVALILTLTCWHGYKRHRSPDILCNRCCSPHPPSGYVQMLPGAPPQYPGLPQYSLVPQGYVESHTADQRLGLMSEGHVTDHPSYSAHLVSASNPSPVEAGMEDCLDRNTTLSRSFKSSHLFQSQSSPFQQQIKEANNDTQAEIAQDNLNNKKLDHVHVFTSPSCNLPPRSTVTTTTAKKHFNRDRLRKSLRSSLSGWSVRQNAFVAAADECPATTETNVDDSTGSDETEEVFLSNNKVKTVVNIGSDSNSSRRSGPRLRRTESQTSNWTDPKKQRSVGSPGRTGNADYFLRQARAPLRSVDIEIGDGSKLATDYVARTRHVTDQRHVSSAPQHPVRRRSDQSGAIRQHNGAKPKDTNMYLRPPSLRRSYTRQYRPGYSESEDVTDFTSDEERRYDPRRLPPRGPSPLSSVGDVSVTPPPPDSTDVSPQTSPLQEFSEQSFTQSEMELVGSPSNNNKPSAISASDVVPSSENGSLQWDDYNEAPSFQKKTN